MLCYLSLLRILNKECVIIRDKNSCIKVISVSFDVKNSGSGCGYVAFWTTCYTANE